MLGPPRGAREARQLAAYQQVVCNASPEARVVLAKTQVTREAVAVARQGRRVQEKLVVLGTQRTPEGEVVVLAAPLLQSVWLLPVETLGPVAVVHLVLVADLLKRPELLVQVVEVEAPTPLPAHRAMEQRLQLPPGKIPLPASLRAGAAAQAVAVVLPTVFVRHLVASTEEGVVVVKKPTAEVPVAKALSSSPTTSLRGRLS